MVAVGESRGSGWQSEAALRYGTPPRPARSVYFSFWSCECVYVFRWRVRVTLERVRAKCRRPAPARPGRRFRPTPYTTAAGWAGCAGWMRCVTHMSQTVLGGRRSHAPNYTSRESNGPASKTGGAGREPPLCQGPGWAPPEVRAADTDVAPAKHTRRTATAISHTFLLGGPGSSPAGPAFTHNALTALSVRLAPHSALLAGLVRRLAAANWNVARSLAGAKR